MQSQGNIRVVEMLRYLYQHTDENHTATVTDITAYLKERGIQAVRQTVYADLNALITAGFDIVIVKSTQNQYFMGNRLFEYPELKMLADAGGGFFQNHFCKEIGGSGTEAGMFDEYPSGRTAQGACQLIQPRETRK